MTKLNALSFLRALLSFIILLHFDGRLLITAQEEGVESEPSPSPTAPPTPEYPKTLSFSMQLLMENAQFEEEHGSNDNKKVKTLGDLFRYTLCLCVFEFDDTQCTKKIQRSSPSPTSSPTTEPTFHPTLDPTTPPTLYPSQSPTTPTTEPTVNPTVDPTFQPTVDPTQPTLAPTKYPTISPTLFPSVSPTENPSNDPTTSPTADTSAPTKSPTTDPTKAPTWEPTISPSSDPTLEPTVNPSASPTSPTMEPTLAPSSNPTMSPSSDPTVSPSSNPTGNPSSTPSSSPTSEPTLEPTVEPTVEPTLEPTATPGGRRRLLKTQKDDDAFAYDTMRSLLAANTSAPTAAPSSLSPSSTPSKAPSAAPTVYTVFDLRLLFFVEVNDREEAEKVFDTISSSYFFNDFKQCLLSQLESGKYSNDSIAAWEAPILSMQPAPFNDVGILSPTFSPTSYPTYDYQAGEDYGYWMIALGICIIVAVALYWAYRRYSIHQDYKEEQKSAPQANVELQSLFENVTPAGDEPYKD
mmetsp:Transcript_10191/g.16405  ORF Transcript_10191/g.16405 Transcript_10191/m.16405 type:complete len:522 (+) Transcript_10191:148-1713(+)